jgi:hypothetical protein
MTTMSATVKSKMHRVTLALENGPSITDAFGREMQISGVTLTYSDGAVSAVQFESGAVSVFVDTVDLEKPESWPAWLRSLVLEYA